MGVGRPTGQNTVCPFHLGSEHPRCRLRVPVVPPGPPVFTVYVAPPLIRPIHFCPWAPHPLAIVRPPCIHPGRRLSWKILPFKCNLSDVTIGVLLLSLLSLSDGHLGICPRALRSLKLLPLAGCCHRHTGDLWLAGPWWRPWVTSSSVATSNTCASRSVGSWTRACQPARCTHGLYPNRPLRCGRAHGLVGRTGPEASPELCLLGSQEHLASASTGGTRGSALSLLVATARSSGHGTQGLAFVLDYPSPPPAPRSGLRQLRVDGVLPARARKRSFQMLAWALSAQLRPSAASRCSPVRALPCACTPVFSNHVGNAFLFCVFVSVFPYPLEWPSFLFPTVKAQRLRKPPHRWPACYRAACRGGSMRLAARCLLCAVTRPLCRQAADPSPVRVVTPTPSRSPVRLLPAGPVSAPRTAGWGPWMAPLPCVLRGCMTSGYGPGPSTPARTRVPVTQPGRGTAWVETLGIRVAPRAFVS